MRAISEVSGREAFEPGEIVEGRYQVLRKLADGGMGTVFLAEHVLIHRRVAIKVLHADLARDLAMVRRFMNEASAAGTLGHPHIVESTDMGFTARGLPFIVFEYLEGCLLTEEVYRVGGLPVRRALQIASQVASALGAAHDARIVHLDLKSDNVFLSDRGDAMDHAKVLDFGIARFMEAAPEHTQRGVLIGTPEFMAPEQITAPDAVDARADIYALGVLLYEMLTARRPHASEDPRILLHRIVHEPPPPLGRPVPTALERLLFDRLLAKSPEARLQTMREVKIALDELAGTLRAESSGPMPRTVAPPEPPPARRRAPRLIWPIAAVVVALSGAALGRAERAIGPSSEARAAIALDAERIASLITGEARAAHARLDGLASAPLLRAAIETDAATVADLVADSQLVRPRPGERLELVQLGGRGAVLLQLPPGGAPLITPPATADKPSTRLAARGSQLVLTVTGPVLTQNGRPGALLAMAAPIDLSLLARVVGRDAVHASLVGLEHPLALDATPAPNTPVVSVPLAIDDLPAPLALVANLPAPSDAMHTVRTASFALAGALLAIYALGWLAYRRS